ncbi:hypothetical protein [Primorskyibacter sedentarius]|uniref:hypothetical protein n=1 Tax=Primorskyibacter sedentarius TaxID=745311 RepID=UPI003EC041E1
MKITLAAALCASFLAAPAMAQSDKATECGIQADLFQLVADLRRDGKRKGRALRTTRAALTDTNRKYEAAVEPMVEYIYAVDKAQLGDDVRTQYLEQCMAAQ